MFIMPINGFIVIISEQSSENQALGTSSLNLPSQCHLAKSRITLPPYSTAALRVPTSKIVLKVTALKLIWLFKDANLVIILQKYH